jgi:nicotinic acid phosphoribosyltransferase
MTLRGFIYNGLYEPITATDAYKLAMAEAGAALRPETFYYSHRKGGLNGWHYMPVDAADFLKSELPLPKDEDYDYLRLHGYEVGAAFRKAFTQMDELQVTSVPKGAWFYNREPAFSAHGASAVVSWLEPAAIRLHHRIQVATHLHDPKCDPDLFKFATCEAERDIVLEVHDQLGRKAPKIEVRTEEYYKDVLDRTKRLVAILKNPDRIFEVGMRAVSCPEQHIIALMAIKEAGVVRTSNVAAAQKLGMVPVGTMGHEHLQRSFDDYTGYVAMRDRFPGFLFYLPDTYSTLYSGIPSALRVIAETPNRPAGIRFDSEHGIRGHYTFTVARAMEMGVRPRLALESGWNEKLTIEFEELREQVRWEADLQAYGYGGYLVNPPWKAVQRDDVCAVWKISQTGSMPVMKFGDEPEGGKSSIPGRPVVYRVNPMEYDERDPVPVSYIVQEGENWKPKHGGRVLTREAEYVYRHSPNEIVAPPVYSPATKKLVRECFERRDTFLASAALRGT